MDKATLNAQLERFRKGFPWLRIIAPATAARDSASSDPSARASSSGAPPAASASSSQRRAISRASPAVAAESGRSSTEPNARSNFAIRFRFLM